MATSPNRARIEYLHALNYAHALSYRARCAFDPVLRQHFATLAAGQFEFVRALRTGDFSKTPIRPLSHFAAAASEQRSAA